MAYSLRYSFDSTNQTYSVYGYSNITKNDTVIIPDTYNDGTNGSHPVTLIKSLAFYNCSTLTSIEIGNNITSIGQRAFYECSNLKNVTIGNSVTIIGDSAFYKCSSLTSITIPNSVTSIGPMAFYICRSLTSVTIGNSVTSIGNNAFNNCNSLTSITIPGSVTSIGGGAFQNCDKLIEVKNLSTLGITAGSSDYGYVGYYAKRVYKEGASYLSTDKDGYLIYDDGTDKILVSYTGTETDLTLPSGITQINQYAFSDCSSLKSITIPNSVKSIGDWAFDKCNSLTSIIIPGSVTSIGDRAFYSCSNLKQLIAFPLTPPTLGTIAFPLTISSIYVQQSSLETYKSATNWNLYLDKIVSNNLYLSFLNFNQENKKYIKAGLDTKYDKTGGVINGEVLITGDLTVNGTQHINNTENLDVKNAMIYSNSDGATLTSNGGLGIKTNSTDVYGIVYEPVGDSVKLGLGKSDAGGKFTFDANEGNPIAVRDDDNKITNNHLLKWNSTNRKLVDSGKSVDDLSTATNLENGTGDVLIQTNDPNQSFKVMKDGRAEVYGTPKDDNDVTRRVDLIAKPITETETIIVDTTTVSFALDTEHDTGMYVSAENAISLGSTQGWDSGRAKYKVIWDGVEYIVYGQSSNVTRMTDLRPTSYYGWQLLGNGSNAKLMMYNKDTLDIPFAITQDRWKNDAEWLVYATTSTAATHTIKVIKVEGTYDKITPEYQYGYLSLVSQNKQNAFIYGTNSIPDRFDGFVAAPGNTVVIDDASKGVSNCIIAADGSYVNVSSANGQLNSPAITGSFNSLYISGLLQSPSLAGYSNQIKNNGATWLAPFVAGYKNNVTADKGTIHPDAIFGSFNEVTYSGDSSYGLNLITGNTHKVKNVSLSLVAGLANTVECLTADNYISANLVGGQQNIVNHSRVVMGGARNKSDRNNQFIAGIYSATNEKALVKIGNGTSDTDRKNAFVVLEDGRVKVQSGPVEGDDVVRKIEFDTKLDSSEFSVLTQSQVDLLF